MQKETPKLGWGHINVNVGNLERAVAFYALLGFAPYRPGIPYLNLTDASGFRPLPDTGAAALGVAAGTRARACILQLGGGFPKLDLIEYEHPADTAGTAAQNCGGGIVRLCLATRDLNGDFARLKKAGVTFVSEPQPCQDGMAHIALCQDPDGALIELIQIHPGKWPAAT